MFQVHFSVPRVFLAVWCVMSVLCCDTRHGTTTSSHVTTHKLPPFLQVQIHSAGSNGKGAPLHALVEDMGDGTYRARYAINVAGQYEVHVRYTGMHARPQWDCGDVMGLLPMYSTRNLVSFDWVAWTDTHTCPHHRHRGGCQGQPLFGARGSRAYRP